MELLPVTPLHAEVLAALHAGASDGTWGASWSTDAFAATLATPGTFGFLALEEGAPLGFALGRGAAGECEVLAIAVLPEYRRRGLGANLMEVLIESARSYAMTRMFLEVAVDNRAARALYDRLGFSTCGVRKGYYHRADGTADATVLELSL